MKLFDCFMYNNEDLLLDLRLNILDKFIHKFVIVESRYDHQGNQKMLNFKIEKFSKFKDKIKYIILDNFPEKYNSWERENYNRNYLIKGLEEAMPDDYIMISDLDEIPKIYDKKIFDKKKYTIFNQKMFYYRFNLHNITEPNWLGSRACKKKNLKSPQWMRSQKIKKYPIWRLDKIVKNLNWNIVEDGGWHFSFVMSSNDIKKKIEAFAHNEFNKFEFKNIENIEKNIALKKDLFGRPFKFIKVEDENNLPEYLIKNKDKYINLLV